MPRGGARPNAGRKKPGADTPEEERPPHVENGPHKATRRERHDLAELARSYTEVAFETLVRIMRSKNTSGAVQVAAIREIFDRGYGKAAQPIRYAGFALDVTRLSDEEIAIAIAIADRLAEARSAQGGTGETRLIEGQLADRPEPGGEPAEVQTP